MLFDTQRHEPLTPIAWSAPRASAAIASIVRDTEEALQGCTWPWHPLDQGRPGPPHKSLYLGTAGVLWALWSLERGGNAKLSIDPAEVIENAWSAYVAEPDTGDVVPSYFLGETGIQLVRWRLTASPQAADRIEAAVRANIPNLANEAFWAAPGTMLAALQMHEWTGEPRWEKLFRENADHLLRTWTRDERLGCCLWTQHLYGEVEQFLGPAHGFAGNAYALLRGGSLLDADQRETLYDRCAETLEHTALVENGTANWYPAAGDIGREGGPRKLLVQWCHGAPGMVTAFTHYPAGRSQALDRLLEKAGETTWSAGPLSKGFGLCHGTAGNGYAFLKLHARTGNAAWLERARSFAMHAIEQSERMREKYGGRRCSLWTGDPGLALYLRDCIAGRSALPSLDSLD